MSDFSELERHAHRARPRLEDRFGRCPLCRQAATAGVTWISIFWSVCEPCGTRWRSGEGLIDDVADPYDVIGTDEPLVTDDEIQAAIVGYLADLKDLTTDQAHERRQETAPMSKHALQMEPIPDYDPWPRAQPPAPGHQPSTIVPGAPAWWYLLGGIVRARLFALTVSAYAQGPLVNKTPIDARVFDTLKRQRDAGDAIAAGAIAWLMNPRFSSSGAPVGELVTILNRAGGALAFLQGQRQQLDRHLDALEAVFKGAVAAR